MFILGSCKESSTPSPVTTTTSILEVLPLSVQGDRTGRNSVGVVGITIDNVAGNELMKKENSTVESSPSSPKNNKSNLFGLSGMKSNQQELFDKTLSDDRKKDKEAHCFICHAKIMLNSEPCRLAFYFILF